MTDEQRIAPAAAEHELAADLNVFKAEREMDEKKWTTQQSQSRKIGAIPRIHKKLIFTVWITF